MIDKGLYRKNFRGGGMDMGNASNQAQSAAMGGGGDNNRGRDLDYQQRGRPKTSVRTTGGDVFAPNDPTAIEKMDYFGPTKFGPAQKYTGSFLDNIFGGGYRNVTPSGRQFQSRFSQMGGLGKGILGGLISLINPVAGLAYKGISSLGALKDYDNLADYARGEFGLFQDEDEEEVDTIDIRDKYNRLGIMNPDIRPTQMFNFDPTQFNTRNRDLGELVAEVTKMDLQKFKQPMTRTMDYDTYKSINPGSTVTPYEFEQLKQGNITEPGIYKV